MSLAMPMRCSPSSCVGPRSLMGAGLLYEYVRAGLSDQCFLFRAELLEALLPFGWLAHLGDLDCCHLVFGAVGRPVRVLRSDDVRARVREVERAIHHAGLHAVR